MAQPIHARKGNSLDKLQKYRRWETSGEYFISN